VPDSDREGADAFLASGRVKAYYLTHPQVEIEPSRPVPQWRLSSRGRARVEAILGKAWLGGIARILSSDEMKAVETAAIVAAHLGLPMEVIPEMGENDRSSTGYL
jgi:broad specificity phosphatase PhoE